MRTAANTLQRISTISRGSSLRGSKAANTPDQIHPIGGNHNICQSYVSLADEIPCLLDLGGKAFDLLR